ncbi:MAG TPA: ABC transporter substrate-binding protein [Stellaceae bacterium]|nr:ABC transporter substrate-binding protein [Stellaceae bacterium]
MAGIASNQGSGIRRLFAGAIALISAAAWSSGGAIGAETIHVGKSSDIAFTFVPIEVALHQKFFEGIDVDVASFGGSAKLQQALVAGAVDVGLAAGTDIPFLVKGAPEIGVGAIALTPALFGVILPYDSPVHQLSDLKGKKIGVTTVGSLTEWLALQIAKKEGWKRDDIKIVADGSSGAAEIAALRTGAVDARISAAALGIDLEQRKQGRLLMPVSDFVGPFLMNVIYVTKDMAEKRPDAVRAFLKGWYKAVAFMFEHKPETVAIAQTVTHFAPSVQEKQYDLVMPSMSRDGTFPPEAVATVEQSFSDLGLLTEKPDMTKYLTTRFLPSR